MSARRWILPWLSPVVTVFAAQPARSETLVIQTSQVCTSNAGDCKTAPSVVGSGQTASLMRSWSSPPAYEFLAETHFATSYGATGLDAAKQPIPGAPISASESGFDYVPEPAPLALAALARARRR